MEKQRTALGNDMDDLAKTFIQENYNNVLGTGVFLMLCNGFPYPVLTPIMEEIINDAPDSLKQSDDKGICIGLHAATWTSCKPVQ